MTRILYIRNIYEDKWPSPIIYIKWMKKKIDDEDSDEYNDDNDDEKKIFTFRL